MKALFLQLLALLFCLSVMLAGCALFKKTTRTTKKDVQSAAKQTQASRLILKTANKETQIFTYWNDSGFYQFQHIKEQIDQAKAGQVNTQEKQEVKQELTVKKNEPRSVWIYAGIGMAALLFLIIVIKKLP